jgi:ubiquinone/menaquinone biosynthesis C-methylase UbiE
VELGGDLAQPGEAVPILPRRSSIDAMALSEGSHAASWWREEEGSRYERGRPDYPGNLVEVLTDELRLRAGGKVVDLAAGTGKLTRLLTSTPADVTAVEPMPGMRSQLRRHAPQAHIVAGTAEHLPLASESVDAATVAQAFHWFDVPVASHELRRVLRPGGRLALVTNKRHTPEPWLRDLWDVLRRYERLAPRPPSTRNWRRVLDETGDFGSFDRFELHNEQHFATLDELDARFTSISFVILLDEEDRAALVRDLHRAVAGVRDLIVPLRTEVEIGTRRG